MELTQINGEKFYFDTNIFIYALEDSKEYKTQIAALFLHIQKSGGLIISSELTLAECLVKPYQKKDELSIKHYEDNIKNSEAMNLISVSQDILKMAAQNKASYRNKLPDAIHVATALESGCDIFVTNDASIKMPTNTNTLILKDLIID